MLKKKLNEVKNKKHELRVAKEKSIFELEEKRDLKNENFRRKMVEACNREFEEALNQLNNDYLYK